MSSDYRKASESLDGGSQQATIIIIIIIIMGADISIHILYDYIV